MRAIAVVAPLILVSGCPAGGGGPPAALAGVWRASFVDPNLGPAQVELILMRDGEFLQQTAYQAGALVTIFGTYRVLPSEALLRLDIQRGEPSESCGPLGCTPIIYPLGESHAYTIPDNNTLILTNVNCTPAGAPSCTFNYARAV